MTGWLRGLWALAACAALGSLRPGAAAAATNPPPSSIDNAGVAENTLDALVRAKLKADGLRPSPPCTDEVFIRRAYLDAIGMLPTPTAVRNFTADKWPAKRRRLIDDLLSRKEFAEYWGLKWGDLLRVKSEFPCNLWPNAVQAYDRWIRESLRKNKPYDRFARELLTSSGSNFRVPPVNFYRAFQERSARQIANNVALVFMGLRLEDSGLTEEQILGFTAFFAKVAYKASDEWKEEIVYFNPDGVLTNPATGAAVQPMPPGGEPLALARNQDPRGAFADWLTAPGNPWFARAIVNRIWFWLLGRGLIHEPDDLKPGNAPWSPELLAYLERELVQHGYDLRHIYRLILTSATYQCDSRPTQWNAGDATGFSRYRIRRLDAEPLLDAINQITGGTEKYVSPIPEPFTVLPPDQHAVELADGSMESPFLELFGRPPRNTSFESERSTTPTEFQAQHLLNSSHIQRKLVNSPVLRQVAAQPWRPAQPRSRNQPPRQSQPSRAQTTIEEVYLLILSRRPTDAEQKIAAAYLESPKRKPQESLCDLAWALINTREFILRH
jgi:hypothetical protein